MKVRFSIKKPGGGRRRFSIMRDVVYQPHDRNVPTDENGNRKSRDQFTVVSAELDAVNERFLEDRKFTIDLAVIHIKKVIIPNLKKKEGEAVRDRTIVESRLREDNLEIFKKHWEKVYEDDDNDNTEGSNQAARGEFMKALELIDPVSIQSADRTTVRNKWRGLAITESQKRRYGVRINELLRAAGRDFTLKLPQKKKATTVIKHVTLKEYLEKLRPAITDPEAQLLADVLMGTGVRLGEAFAFNNPDAIKRNNTIHVHQQMLRAKYGCEIVDRIKNGRARDTVCLEPFVKSLKEWCEIPLNRKRELRASSEFLKTVNRTSRRAFKNPMKHLKNHDLRHSYAIFMLGAGHLVSEIALYLGDSEATVIAHYTGFIATDPHVDHTNLRIKAALKAMGIKK